MIAGAERILLQRVAVRGQQVARPPVDFRYLNASVGDERPRVEYGQSNIYYGAYRIKS